MRKTTGGVTTIFAYDEAGHLIGEYDVGGSPIREYLWLGDIPVAVITGGPGTPPYIYWYVHVDHLNTPRQVENPTSGEIVWRWESAPFGVRAQDHARHGAPGAIDDGFTASPGTKTPSRAVRLNT